MGEPRSGIQEGTPRAQTPSMLSIYLERSQTAQSQTSEPEQAPVSLPAAPEPANEPSLRPLVPSFSLESIPVGAQPALSEAASTSQSPFFRSISQALPASQSYLLPQQPQTTAAPVSISAVSSSLSLGSLTRQPGAAPPTIQSARGPATGAPFSPSSSAISLPSTTAEEAYGEQADPLSSGGPLMARGGVTAEELATMDPKRAKRLIANRQSAQRSKARKLRHIMQLEDEVASLQGITQQQMQRLGALQQEIALLSTANQQLAVQAAELQGQVGSYESFAELCIQELRRLSMLAGEPFQLPALPPPAQVTVQDPQMAQQAVAAQYGAPDLALQQQMAAQGRLPGAMQYPPMGQQPQAQRMPGGYVGEPGGAPYLSPRATPRTGAQRGPGGPVILGSSSHLYTQPMGRGNGRGSLQRSPRRSPRRQQRPGAAGMTQAPGAGPVPAQGQPIEPASEPPRHEGLQAASSTDVPRGSSLPSSGTVQVAAQQALAMAERHRMHASGELDAGQAAIAAAEARRAAMSAEGRGQPAGTGQLQLAMSRATSGQQEALLLSARSEEAGRAPAQLPGRRPDPFRTIVPASAFRMEERASFGGAGSGELQSPGRRQLGMPQQLPTMPEQQALAEMGSWQQQPVGWPLGPRAQQPYPAASISSVGSVMQAFRGLSMHGSDPPGYGLTTRAPMTPQQMRMQSQLPLLQGRLNASMSWDEMMRSLSDPVYGYDAQGNPSFPHGLYPQASQISRAAYDIFYNPEQQQQPGGEGPGHQPGQ